MMVISKPSTRNDLIMSWVYWAIASAGFAAITAILAKLGVKDVQPDLATAIRTVVILILSWTIVLTRVTQPVTSLSMTSWLFLVLSGLATGASWLCYFRALQLGPASQVAPIDKLSVVFVMLLAAMFLGETMSWRHILGGSFIVIGAIVLAKA